MLYFTTLCDYVYAVPARIISLEPAVNLVVNQTDSATFVCTATGLPTPSVQWYRGTLLLDGTGMGINSRVALNQTMAAGSLGQVDTVTSSLTITDTLGEDSDIYSCVTTNNLLNINVTMEGRDQQNTTLFVQGIYIYCLVFFWYIRFFLYSFS